MIAPTGQPRILIAHELALYSQTLAALVAGWRHHVEIRVLSPSELEASLAAAPGAIVITDRLTPALVAHACAWILYYPECANVAIAGGHGATQCITEPCLADVLAMLDRLVTPCFPG